MGHGYETDLRDRIGPNVACVRCPRLAGWRQVCSWLYLAEGSVSLAGSSAARSPSPAPEPDRPSALTDSGCGPGTSAPEKDTNICSLYHQTGSNTHMLLELIWRKTHYARSHWQSSTSSPIPGVYLWVEAGSPQLTPQCVVSGGCQDHGSRWAGVPVSAETLAIGSTVVLSPVLWDSVPPLATSKLHLLAPPAPALEGKTSHWITQYSKH